MAGFVIVDDLDVEAGAVADALAHDAAGFGVGERTVEEIAGASAQGFVARVAGDAGEALVDPLDFLLRVGDDDGVAGVAGHHGEAAGGGLGGTKVLGHLGREVERARDSARG